MITSKQELLYYILEDAKANKVDPPGGVRYYIRVLYGNVNACVYRYLKSLRNYEYYQNKKCILRYWYRFYNRRLGIKYNLAIPINTIGPGIYIPHIEGGIIINCKSIGCGCKINSGVVIGNKNGDNCQIPEIGDNVELCVGSKIIGQIRIGNNVLVAPNAVVVRDVPDNAIVAGIPAKIIRMKEPL